MLVLIVISLKTLVYSNSKDFYLTTINDSSTDPTVVYETMRQSQAVAKERNEYEFNITYVLAITKIALLIQPRLNPHFNNVFISLSNCLITREHFNSLKRLYT